MAERPSRWNAPAGLAAAVVLALWVTQPGRALPLGLPSVPVGPAINNLPGTIARATGTVDRTLDRAITVVERDTVGRPLKSRAPEYDPSGDKVVRGEVLALAPTAANIAVARRLGFDIIRQDNLPSLQIAATVLSTPDGENVTDALEALRKADPSGNYDYNHLYDPSGDGQGVAQTSPSRSEANPVACVGMIDAGVDRRHPAFRGTSIAAKVFAGHGDAPATAHGTAVASLLVGRDGDFRGALQAGRLYAADVFGGAADGGSAEEIARALGWMDENRVAVVNVSLAGPPNALLGAATAAFVKRGHVLVAAVGNDGPAAPLRFPAAYPGVIGVTSVDAQGRVQIDANRGSDVAFAALGVNVRAAALDRRYADVTGTSFAAPVVAARYAELVGQPDLAEVESATATLVRSAHRATPRRDDTYGFGVLDSPALAAAVTAAAGHPH